MGRASGIQANDWSETSSVSQTLIRGKGKDNCC